MEILAFSDLHCDRATTKVLAAESEKADLVVGAGDFGIEGNRTSELFNVLFEIAVPLILVSGNHDCLAELTEICKERNNVHLLQGDSVEVEGTTFFGLGGEIPARSDALWNQTMNEEDADGLFGKAGSHSVLVTHTPPFGYCDLQRDGTHEGSASIAKGIERYSPELCLCGHIHHSWGSVQRLGNTTVHNLGPRPGWHTL